MSEIWNPVSKSGEEPFVNKFHNWEEVIQHYKTEKNRLTIEPVDEETYSGTWKVLGVKEGDYYMEFFSNKWYIAYQGAEPNMYVAENMHFTETPRLTSLRWLPYRNTNYWADGEFWIMSDINQIVKFSPSKKFINWTENPFEEVKG